MQPPLYSPLAILLLCSLVIYAHAHAAPLPYNETQIIEAPLELSEELKNELQELNYDVPHFKLEAALIVYNRKFPVIRDKTDAIRSQIELNLETYKEEGGNLLAPIRYGYLNFKMQRLSENENPKLILTYFPKQENCTGFCPKSAGLQLIYDPIENNAEASLAGGLGVHQYTLYTPGGYSLFRASLLNPGFRYAFTARLNQTLLSILDLNYELDRNIQINKNLALKIHPQIELKPLLITIDTDRHIAHEIRWNAEIGAGLQYKIATVGAGIEIENKSVRLKTFLKSEF